ncbi:MAG: hypothetical protein L0Y66_22640 [Myxococcaceae bacterium]|nr:hypothetical protein [Myxococcaceae bacterium]MCI0670552.1 hypothetical protein [Myxococcaceae bacterium]
MRGVFSGLLVVCLAAGVARAEEVRLPPTSTPESAAPDASPAVTPAPERGELASRPERYSGVFAGPGGPFLVVNEALLGLAAGAVVARATQSDPNRAFLSVVGGATVLAGLGFTYSHFVPVGRKTAVLGAFASVAGFLMGAGINAYARIPDGLEQGLVVVGTGQAALAAILLSTLGQADISGGDMGVVITGGTWGLLLSLMAVGAFTPAGVTPDFRPVLFMPAMGMALGGVVAALTEVKGNRIPALAILPMAVGVSLYGLGALMNAPQAGATVGMAATAGTLALMLLLGPSPLEEPSRVADADDRDAPHIVALPMALPAGTRGQDVALGGGVALAF